MRPPSWTFVSIGVALPSQAYLFWCGACACLQGPPKYGSADKQRVMAELHERMLAMEAQVCRYRVVGETIIQGE